MASRPTHVMWSSTLHQIAHNGPASGMPYLRQVPRPPSSLHTLGVHLPLRPTAPAGSLLCSGSDDTQVCVWSMDRRRLRTSMLTGHSANIFCTRFVPGTGALPRSLRPLLSVAVSCSGHLARTSHRLAWRPESDCMPGRDAKRLLGSPLVSTQHTGQPTRFLVFSARPARSQGKHHDWGGGGLVMSSCGMSG